MILPPTKPSQSTRLAVFDFDGTLVRPKQGRRFPKDVEDWEWWDPKVPVALRDLVRRRFRLVLRTDQSKPWKIDMIRAVLASVPVSATVIVGVEKEEKKPHPGDFWTVFEGLKEKIQWKKSFYVGDAAGRTGDWSAVDVGFAKAVGLPFYTPEAYFLGADATAPVPVPPPDTNHVVIMVGFPGAGKSTWAHTHLPAAHIFHGDDYKTLPAMVKAAHQYHATHPTQTIAFDTTGGTLARRAVFLKFAQDIGFTPVCVWIQTPLNQALNQIQLREQKEDFKGPTIPKIALYTYQKHFQPPTDAECRVVPITPL